MSTAVVVATIVNTNLSQAGFRQHVVEQLRVNDRNLLDRLADADDDADVVTAVFDVDEFLAYLIRRFPKAVDAAISNSELHNDITNGATNGAIHGTTVAEPQQAEQAARAVVDPAQMSEGEFMNFVLQQLDSGEIEPMVRFADNDWEDQWDDDGDIGEDISRYPFYY